MRVLSFGGGVQTVVLAAMAALDEIERPDFAVFADPQWEKRATYAYLAWFIPWCAERGLRIITTTKGNLRADALDNSKRFASMPLWTETGFLVHRGKEKGALRRQCTNEYKIDPVNKVIRREAGIGPGQRWKGEPVELQLGISLDEFAARGNMSRDAWVRFTYPLVDKRMTRGDCLEWLKRHDMAPPPQVSLHRLPLHRQPVLATPKAGVARGVRGRLQFRRRHPEGTGCGPQPGVFAPQPQTPTGGQPRRGPGRFLHQRVRREVPDVREKSVVRIVVQVYIGGSYAAAVEACREFVNLTPLCVSVQPTDFVFTHGMESGVCVTLVNYPRFPTNKRSLNGLGRRLGLYLMKRLHQGSFLMHDGVRATWFDRRRA